MTIGEVLRRSTDHLAARGAGRPRLDAERLLAHALGLERVELYMHLDRPLSVAELDGARALVRRRAAGEPLQYVLGEWGFRRLTLRVDGRALIPRPETETLVERCLALLDGDDAPRVLDVGAGSGAVALALADEHPGARVTAIDVSEEALSLARENAERTGLTVELLCHDLFAGLPGDGWDLVVSNPPYVRDDELASLASEVVDWEPAPGAPRSGAHRGARPRRGTGPPAGRRACGRDARGQRVRRRRPARPRGIRRGAHDEGPRRPRPGRRGAHAGVSVDAAVAALRAGRLVVLPTDTVYGLAADGESEPAARALYAAKGRDAIQPTAVLFASVDVLVERVPELPAAAAEAARTLLPGPFTLIVENPARRYAWLNRQRPDALGLRVPAVTGAPRAVLEALGAVVATSANLPGDPDPRRVADVPPEIAAAVDVVIDGGELPGTPSTVVDLTRPEPRVLREGAVPAADILERLRGLTDR